MKPRRALLLVRAVPEYRMHVFGEGVRRLGFDARVKPFHDPNENDLLIIWNRMGTGGQLAKLFEKRNAAVIVAENSYLNIRGAKKSFALALNYHNGAGSWPTGDHSRFGMLDIEVKPWKTTGKYITMLPQRGIGTLGVAMPKDWTSRTSKKIEAQKHTRPIFVRKHPGSMKKHAIVPLEKDLARAWTTVTWGSGAAIKAVIEGVPTFYDFAKWIAGPAACFGSHRLKDVTDPISLMGNREQMLERLSWAQWSGDEVLTSEPIQRLLDLHKKNVSEVSV